MAAVTQARLENAARAMPTSIFLVSSPKEAMDHVAPRASAFRKFMADASWRDRVMNPKPPSCGSWCLRPRFARPSAWSLSARCGRCRRTGPWSVVSSTGRKFYKLGSLEAFAPIYPRTFRRNPASGLVNCQTSLTRVPQPGRTS